MNEFRSRNVADKRIELLIGKIGTESSEPPPCPYSNSGEGFRHGWVFSELFGHFLSEITLTVQQLSCPLINRRADIELKMLVPG